MTLYIAFLRAINITGHFVKMEALRSLFESLGLSTVTTYMQSGNVLFQAADMPIAVLEHTLEERLRHALGYPVATFVRLDTELIELAQYWPFPAAARDDRSVLYIAFLRAEPSAIQQRTVQACSSAIDTLHVCQRQVFWLWHKHRGATTFSGAKLEKILDAQATVRNATTVRKIVAKYLR